MSDLERIKAHARARERREIVAALAWNNAQSVMPEERAGERRAGE